MRVVALAGGGGAAKFLRGLVQVMDPARLTIIGNTGDDARIHGLHVSPDLDIVAYALGGVLGEAGWGFEKETFQAMEQLRVLGAESWFTLGDRDLGTHLARTGWMDKKIALSEITRRIVAALGVRARILPMSDDRVETKLTTLDGIERDFQEYFVRFHHKEEIAGVRFEGAAEAAPAPGVLSSIGSADKIIICPSNPVISIGPILAVPGIREALTGRKSSVCAISPIVEGKALKGPADRLLGLWGAESSARGVAGLYSDICGVFVLDERDAATAPEIEHLGMRAVVAETVMTSDEVAAALASLVLNL